MLSLSLVSNQAAGLNTAIHAFWAVADADGDKNLTKV